MCLQPGLLTRLLGCSAAPVASWSTCNPTTNVKKSATGLGALRLPVAPVMTQMEEYSDCSALSESAQAASASAVAAATARARGQVTECGPLILLT